MDIDAEPANDKHPEANREEVEKLNNRAFFQPVTIQSAAVLEAVKARPGNDGACGQSRATADLDRALRASASTRVGRGEETGFQVEQRNWNEGKKWRMVYYYGDYASCYPYGYGYPYGSGCSYYPYTYSYAY